MMGAGKSTIGKSLAEKTSRQFVDTDKLIEKRLGRSIPQIFKLYGEQAFRDHESAVIRELEPSLIVVATGGGAIQRDENWDHLQSIGKTIYLRSQPEELIQRLETSKKKRPLLNTENWEERLKTLLDSRKDRYESAQIVLDVDGLDQNEVVERILGMVNDQ